MTNFPHIFRPIRIGNVDIKNRIFLPPHGTNFANIIPNEKLARYYQERARGGVGLIVHEAVVVHPSSFSREGKICGWMPEVINGYRQIADAVHNEGAKIFCQLAHMGRQMTSFHSRQPLWAPSAIPCAEMREMPHVMTKAEIMEIVEAFAKSAANCREGGLDGVEIHAANGYLIQEFLSPFSNKRTDEYGGSLENRMRFLRQVISAVRREVGNDYVVGVRISGEEMVPGGLTQDDVKQIVSLLEQDGNIDYVSLSVGNYSVHSIIIADMFYPRATIRHLASGLKRMGTKLPVLVSIRITDGHLAESILAAGEADMVGMARALIADPFLPKKLETNKQDTIRPCIYCNQECRDRIGKGGQLSCVVNPAVGHEESLGYGTLTKATESRKVVVVGGGVGGMECALTAAKKGHRVVLFEAEEQLGGQVALAAKVPSRSEFGLIAKYLVRCVQKENIDLRLGIKVSADQVLAEKPDVVVIATGSVPRMPDIPGIEKCLSVWDVLKGTRPIGNRVLVYDDGEGFWPFCSILDYLSEKGHHVEAVTRLNFVGASIPSYSIPPLYERLFGRDVNITVLHVLQEVRDDYATIRHVYSGKVRHVPVDSVVVAAGRWARDELARQISGTVPEVHIIGDALAPRRASDAIREGHLAARAI